MTPVAESGPVNERVEPTTIGSPDGAPPLGSAPCEGAVDGAALSSLCVASTLAGGLSAVVPQAASTSMNRTAATVNGEEDRCIGRCPLAVTETEPRISVVRDALRSGVAGGA